MQKSDWSGYCQAGNHRFCHHHYFTPRGVDLACPCACHGEVVEKKIKAKSLTPKPKALTPKK